MYFFVYCIRTYYNKVGFSKFFFKIICDLPFQGKVGRWTRAYHLKVPPPPLPPQPSRGGPRQRFLPTPRGVNMIVWSLDNRFVLAAIMGKVLSVVLLYGQKYNMDSHGTLFLYSKLKQSQ